MLPTLCRRTHARTHKTTTVCAVAKQWLCPILIMHFKKCVTLSVNCQFIVTCRRMNPTPGKTEKWKEVSPLPIVVTRVCVCMSVCLFVCCLFSMKRKGRGMARCGEGGSESFVTEKAKGSKKGSGAVRNRVCYVCQACSALRRREAANWQRGSGKGGGGSRVESMDQ